MKHVYVQHVLASEASAQPVKLLGWVKRRRNHGRMVFLDIADSTGTVQAVCREGHLDAEGLDLARHCVAETAVCVTGVVETGAMGQPEFEASSLEVVGPSTVHLSPHPRDDFDAFASNRIDHLLSNRHVYVRHPMVMAALAARHEVVGFLHEWFRSRSYVEIHAPVLTASSLYDDGTALSLEVHNERVYLTQCVGFYLEACVHAFERVYNIGPSFRGEESRSRRHLVEYWHVKAELAFVDREDLFGIVESLMHSIALFSQEQLQGHAAVMRSAVADAPPDATLSPALPS